MIRIGVLSDTHLHGLRQGGAVLEQIVQWHFSDVQLILHAGDLVDADLLALPLPCPLYAVRGNLDPPHPDLPLKRVLDVGGFRLGLIHGWGSPQGLATRVRREFQDQNLDCLVFGHSHTPCCEEREGLLLFNPGSPTDRRLAPFHSVGVLELNEGIAGRIINLDGE